MGLRKTENLFSSKLCKFYEVHKKKYKVYLIALKQLTLMFISTFEKQRREFRNVEMIFRVMSYFQLTTAFLPNKCTGTHSELLLTKELHLLPKRTKDQNLDILQTCLYRHPGFFYRYSCVHTKNDLFIVSSISPSHNKRIRHQHIVNFLTVTTIVL